VSWDFKDKNSDSRIPNKWSFVLLALSGAVRVGEYLVFGAHCQPPFCVHKCHVFAHTKKFSLPHLRVGLERGQEPILNYT
jgi:hypothetical protein